MENNNKADNLHHNGDILSVELLLNAAQGKLKSLGGKKEKQARRGSGYLKRRVIHGRPYWYRVHKVKVDSKWKNKETYLGTRKPRK